MSSPTFHCFWCGDKLQEIGLGISACRYCDAQFVPSQDAEGRQCMVGGKPPNRDLLKAEDEKDVLINNNPKDFTTTKAMDEEMERQEGMKKKAEGDFCGIDGCDGVLEHDSSDCSCNVHNAPCPSCESPVLSCPECGEEVA